MTVLDLAGALRVARAIRTTGVPACIATVVASRVPSAQVAARVVLADGVVRAGSIHPGLDRVLAASLPEFVRAGRSRLSSYTVANGDALPVRTGAGNVDVYLELVSPPPRLVIVGAGHIAVPLARMAGLVGFEIAVVDDRAEFASPDRFPDADEIHVGPYRETLARVAVDRATYVVLVTRGHVHDQACLEEVLDREVAYIGMIGSKRRVRTVAEHAVQAGAAPERVRRVHAPIGLDIGAHTPAEIAVAILAEIIAVRRGKNVPSLALRERLGV